MPPFSFSLSPLFASPHTCSRVLVYSCDETYIQAEEQIKEGSRANDHRIDVSRIHYMQVTVGNIHIHKPFRLSKGPICKDLIFNE